MVWLLLLASCVACIFGAPTLRASPTVLASSPATVELVWDGLSDGEYVYGLYFDLPGLIHLAASAIPRGASGSVNVSVVNPRVPFYFKICEGTDCSPAKAVVQSNTVHFANYNEPQHPRLAMTSDPTTLAFSFTTAEAFAPPQVSLRLPSGGVVVYNGTSRAPFTIKDMCFSPANSSSLFFDPGYQHLVLLTSLQPGQSYQYQFGGASPAGPVWSSEHVLRVPPAPGKSATVSAVVYGDMGVAIPYDSVTGGSNYPVAHETVRWAAALLGDAELDPSLIIHIGDISYARGYPFVWEWFMTAIAPVASQVPYLVGIGNHEYDYRGYGQWAPAWTPYGLDSGGECGVSYSARFDMPATPQFMPPDTGRPNRKNLWYSVEQGPIHYTIMSTEHDFEVGTVQYNFLKADLAGVDRSRTPWIVFLGHRPMYTTESSLASQFERTFTATIEPLFRQYSVDVALWGHVHKYERTCGIVHNGTCGARDEDGTVHVVIGNAGNDYQAPWYSTSVNHYPEPEWLIFRTFDYGISTLTANATTFVFQAHGWKRNDVHDMFVLTK